MIRVDSDTKTIHITRGDRGGINVTARNYETGERYNFPAGCKVSFVIVPQKGYTQGALLRKNVTVLEETDEVYIPLLEEDTKIGNMIDKKEKFWYNVVVNDDVTIIGSDQDGEKRVILYPEVGENNE